MQLCRLHFFGVPCPGWLMPRVVAEESGRNGRVDFHIRAEVPYMGAVAGYEGHLLLPKAVSA